MSRTLPNAIASVLDDTIALDKRLEGKSFRIIAEEMGLSSARQAYIMVRRALDTVEFEAAERAAELRDTTIERNDVLISKLYQNAIKGDLFSVDRIIKLQDQSAKLIGAFPKDDKERDDTLSGPIIILPAMLSDQSVAGALPPPSAQTVVGGVVVAAAEPPEASYAVVEEPNAQDHEPDERAPAFDAESLETALRTTNGLYEQSGMGSPVWRKRGPWEDGLPRDGSDEAG